MFLEDTLSRAFLPEVHVSVLVHELHELREIDHKASLLFSDAWWNQIENVSSVDPVFWELLSVIQHGWPFNGADVAQCLYPYFDIQDELTLQGKLVLRATTGRTNLTLQGTNGSSTRIHIGVEPCIWLARDSLYWPRMTTELKEYIAKCDISLAHRSEQCKEPIEQHDFAARPWSKVAVDLCDLDGRTLLVMSDYYSNYVEVAHITSITSRSIINELKAVFVRFGIPEVLVTDPQPAENSCGAAE